MTLIAHWIESLHQTRGDSGSLISSRQGFRAYVALCAFAGLRKGEAAAVQVGDVDFTGRCLSVARQLQRDGKTYAIRPPKYNSERLVYLPDDLVVILEDHVSRHVAGNAASSWLFTIDGEPMNDNAVTWRWRATRSTAFRTCACTTSGTSTLQA